MLFKGIRLAVLLSGMLIFSPMTPAQIVLKHPGWEWRISETGCAEQLIFKNKQRNDTVPFFRKGDHAGPSFYAKREGKEIRAPWIPDGYASYRSEIDGVLCCISYTKVHGQPALRVKLTNESPVPFQPQKAGLKLGIDTYMDKYPDWFGKYFPTLMRNEKTHFYGYLQTPSGHTLGLVSQQPVASWSVDYNLGYQDPAPFWFMGHRIESLNLDLLNALPLPARHPQDLYELKQGESKEWTFLFINVGKLDNLEYAITQAADIPLIDIRQTSYAAHEEASFMLTADTPEVKVTNDVGAELPVVLTKAEGKRWMGKVKLGDAGLYTLSVRSGNKVAEAVWTVHHPWQWVMKKARENVARYHQKPTSHAESWYGFYSAFLTARYFPDKTLDKQLSDYFDQLYNKLHDPEKVEPLYFKTRIQNTSTTIGMLADKYEAQGNLEDLKKASKLADWMIRTSQRDDGAYYNHGTVYTSVIYIAKSVLELAVLERKLGEQDPFWKDCAERHFLSAKKAIDQLVASQGDFQTEGELTFEDGMISCSALQIGMMGVLEKDAETRKYYTDAMLKILNSHDCLTQLRVPDGRRRQGTMRYWEAQYDVQMLPNMFNSPHGWSGWRAYATYYAYLLTGDEKWLEQTFNAMGAFANLIDYKTGQLRWAFVVDPHLEVEQACSADTKLNFSDLSFGNPHPKLYDTRKFVIGEQYVNMISDWQTVNTQDNDVHELFKCIGETVLTNAFVIERPNGEVVGYNCRVSGKGNTLTVKADEKQIVNLHCNLKQPFSVTFGGKSRSLPKGYCDWAFGQSGY